MVAVATIVVDQIATIEVWVATFVITSEGYTSQLLCNWGKLVLTLIFMLISTWILMWKSAIPQSRSVRGVCHQYGVRC